MGVSILEGSKAERVATALEMIALNGAGQAPYADNWKGVQSIVRAGLGEKAFPVGTIFKVEKETSLTAALGVHTGITAVSVTEETFINKIGNNGSGVHEFKFDGAAWIYEEAAVRLADYGLTVTGTAADGDEIVVTESIQVIEWVVIQHKLTDDGISEYAQGTAYLVGALCTKNGYVWQCNTAITSEAWNSAHWNRLYPAGEHRMVVFMVPCWYNRPFDNAEALIYASEALPAGSYKFKVVNNPWVSGDNNTYFYFTTDVEIPAGAQGYTNAGYNASENGKTLTFYTNATKATTVCTVTMSNVEISGATDLGTCRAGNINDVARAKVGSNNYKEGAIRQWINSNAKANEWWAAQHKFDGKSSYANEAGFLHGMDADFLEVVQPTAVRCGTNNTWELDGWTLNTPYTVVDKFYLLSSPEVGFNADNTQGSVMEYFRDAKNVDRVKYDFGGTARGWWLRSPYPSSASYVRAVISDGSLSYGYASYGTSAAAACEIG